MANTITSMQVCNEQEDKDGRYEEADKGPAENDGSLQDISEHDTTKT